MNPGNVAVTVVILSIIQVVGGLSVGGGLIALRARRFGGLGGIVGGTLLGGLTFMPEVVAYLGGILDVLLLLVGPIVFLVAIYIRIFLWDSLVEELDPLFSLAPGASFFVLALIPVWLDWEWIGLLWTGIMTVLGIFSIRKGLDDLRLARTRRGHANEEENDKAKGP